MWKNIFIKIDIFIKDIFGKNIYCGKIYLLKLYIKDFSVDISPSTFVINLAIRIEAFLERSLFLSRDQFFSFYLQIFSAFSRTKLIAIDSPTARNYFFMLQHTRISMWPMLTLFRHEVRYCPPLGSFFSEFYERLSQPAAFDGLLKEFARRLAYPCI